MQLLELEKIKVVKAKEPKTNIIQFIEKLLRDT